MPKSSYALVTRTRRQVKSAKPREYILGDGNGNIYSDGQYLVRQRGPADENGNPTYGPVSRAFGGHANFLEKPNRHVYVAPNHKGQPVITEPVWEDMQQAGITPSVIHPNTPYRQFNRLKDIQNFKAVIVNPDGFKVSIRELVYLDPRTGTPQIWMGTDESTHVDLVDSVPATPGYHCYALISFSQDLKALGSYPLQVTTSTPQAITTAVDTTDMQEALDAMSTDNAPISFYRLVNGKPGLGTGDDYDLDFRQFLTLPGVRDASITIPKLANNVLHLDAEDPASDDDETEGYATGSIWINETDSIAYICVDASTGTAVWIEITGGGAGSDTDAIHKSVAGEIAGLIEKSTPISDDWVVIEDSAASNAKKKIKLSSITAATVAYPKNAIMNIYTQSITAGNTTLSRDYSTVQEGGRIFRSSPANGDAFENSCLLAAGTYNLKILGEKALDKGILQVKLNGTTLGTIDFYNASTIFNFEGILTSISVPTSGTQKFTFTITGKHASSNNYYFIGTHMYLYPTGGY